MSGLYDLIGAYGAFSKTPQTQHEMAELYRRSMTQLCDAQRAAQQYPHNPHNLLENAYKTPLRRAQEYAAEVRARKPHMQIVKEKP